MTTAQKLEGSALADLRERLAGTVALPNEAGYELSAPWNQSVTMCPAAAVCAAHADDVAVAVQWASSNGFRVAVQLSGHGAVPYGEDVLLIHTGRLQRCEISGDQHTAKVGAGVSSQQLIDAAAPFGLAPPVGTSGDVGFVGFLSGGGIGPMAATFGLSSDYVRSLDVVTGQGEKYHVSESEHGDLFWGLRGSKATLGIITEVEIELPFLTTFYAGALYFDGADFSEVLQAWAQWSDSLPNLAATALSVLQLPDMPSVAPELAGRLAVAVRLTTPVSVTAAERLLAPMRAVARPIKDTMAERPYSDITGIYDEPTNPVPVQKDLTLLQSLPPEAVDAMVNTAGPHSGSPMLVVELRRLGGALARSSAAPSAFSHREAEYMLLTIGLNVPPDRQIVADAGQRIHRALRPWAIDGIFANFVATTNQDQLRTAYDELSLRRLQAMAQQYDPLGTLATVGQLAR
jgi:FAD/FMN-containing dehydrogenase